MANTVDGINFDGVAATFSDYDATLRGYVRYQLVHRNLEPYLPKKPLHILDLGGGSGPDTAWLVTSGHYVTMVESSQEQVAYAQRRFNYFLEDAERDRITIVAGNIGSIQPADAQFDMILIHGVAMYQPDPTAFISTALARLKPGGTLSLLEKGYFGAEARAIRQQSYEDLTSLHANQHVINNMNRRAYAFKPDEIEQLLKDNSMRVKEWSGVRLISDEMYMRVTDIDAELTHAIVDAEYRQGHDINIRGQGQMLHFIAKKKS